MQRDRKECERSLKSFKNLESENQIIIGSETEMGEKLYYSSNSCNKDDNGNKVKTEQKWFKGKE